MQIQKIRIISDLICYGHCPFPDKRLNSNDHKGREKSVDSNLGIEFW